MASDKVVKLTETDFEAVALKAVVPVLVDFWASWCGPCRMVAPFVDQLAEEYDGRAVIAKVDVDESPALAGQYGVMSIPTLMVFKNGAMVEKCVGARGKSDLAAMIERAL